MSSDNQMLPEIKDPPRKQKVFGIGFHKTATTSLAVALYTLGYNVTGFLGFVNSDFPNNVYEVARDLANRYDAVQDTPWPVLYKELDQWYPDSKFILTVRPKDKWIKSVVKHFKNHHVPAHEWIYGVRTAAGNEPTYIRHYEKHNQEVINYFAQRPNDLLVMDITKGDGWEKLCPFLGLPTPSIDFPKNNTAKEQFSKIVNRVRMYIKKKVGLYDQVKVSMMMKGVSAAFVRDIYHYHDTMTEKLWQELLKLSDIKFEQKNPVSGCSIRDYLTLQFFEEHKWLKRFKGENLEEANDMMPTELHKKEDLYAFWLENRTLLRDYIANLTDDDCNARLSNSNEYVWEVLVHLMNFGTEQRSFIRQALGEYNIEFQEQTFINFYR